MLNLGSSNNLELPAISAHRTEEAIEEKENPAVLNDPARSLRPFDVEARMVAKKAGLDEDIVLYRAAELLDQRAQERRWGVEYDSLNERRLNRFLDDVDLRVSFSKSHIEPAVQAVAHVTAELWDDGRLSVKSSRQIVASLFRQDSSLVSLEPKPRPHWLPTIGGIPQDDRVHSVPEGWLEQSEESLAYLHPRTPDGRIILGERSRFAYLGTDTRIEERRTSHIVEGSEVELWRNEVLEKEVIPFYRVHKRPAKWYPKIDAPRGHFVIAHGSFDVQTPAARWIALNPKLGEALGWRLDPDTCFRWVDDTGALSVESVWWRDGNPERQDRTEYCSVGEGWLVLATETAYRQLIEKTNQFNRGGLVRRSAGFAGLEGSDFSRTRLPSIR